jgi:hypothetical protein
MFDLSLVPGTYLLPTPAGAYYAAYNQDSEPARTLLFKLMSCEEAPPLTLELLEKWLETRDEAMVLELVWRMQSMGWIQGDKGTRNAPSGALDEILPGMLAPLSSEKKALLADNGGFYVANSGYPHETAEEISALSADLASLYERHRGLVYNNLRIPSTAWGIIDAAGNSHLGFWPLYIGKERFVLALSGSPCLNQPSFTDLVWALARRYADVPLEWDGGDLDRDSVASTSS